MGDDIDLAASKQQRLAKEYCQAKPRTTTERAPGLVELVDFDLAQISLAVEPESSDGAPGRKIKRGSYVSLASFDDRPMLRMVNPVTLHERQGMVRRLIENKARPTIVHNLHLDGCTDRRIPGMSLAIVPSKSVRIDSSLQVWQ